MTIEEFNKTAFGAGDSAAYKNKVYPIASVDFEEKLIGLQGVTQGAEEDSIDWVRCENIEFISARKFFNHHK